MCNKELNRMLSKIKIQNAVRITGVEKGEKLAGATLNLGNGSGA